MCNVDKLLAQAQKYIHLGWHSNNPVMMKMWFGLAQYKVRKAEECAAKSNKI
jgi:hypothetical protein